MARGELIVWTTHDAYPEDENWLVRTMIEIFKPMLSWLMDRTTLVCWLFVIILGLTLLQFRVLGRRVHYQ